ncbi:hypothetical protein EMIT0P12_40406 [Pseudomonas sp. IT-P12]
MTRLQKVKLIPKRPRRPTPEPAAALNVAGASTFAKYVKASGHLIPRVIFTSIASKLAPTQGERAAVSPMASR